MSSTHSIESVLTEKRSFPPPAHFAGAENHGPASQGQAPSFLAKRRGQAPSAELRAPRPWSDPPPPTSP